MFSRACAGLAISLVFTPIFALAEPTAAQTTKPAAAEQSELDSLVGSEPVGPSQPAPRMPDGHPDFTGFWRPLQEKGKPTGNIGRDEPGFKLPFTPAGQAALTQNLTKIVDPEARCILGGIPRHNASGLPFQILQTPKRLAFLYLYVTYRMVPLDGRQHEEDAEPKYFGSPIGSWDGDTLVVDSVGFKDSKDGTIWADENGNPESDATHIIERWTLPDADHVHLEMTMIDPKYYTRPIKFARTWGRATNDRLSLTEYACNENNVDAAHLGPGPGIIGPDGNRGYGATPKLPDTPPSPDAYETKH